MQGEIHTYKVIIAENYLDAFGHMNNAVYFDLFEQARWDLLNKNGFSLQFIRDSKTGPVILSAKIRYLKEVLARDEITIVSQLTSYAKKIGTLSQYMLRNDVCVCESEFTIALFDLTARKLLPPTPAWLRAMGVAEQDSLKA